MAASAGGTPVRPDKTDSRQRARIALSELARDLDGMVFPVRPGPPSQQLARMLRPLVPGLATRIGEQVQREVPGYTGPVEGGRRRLIELAASGAIGEFLALVEDPRSSGKGVDELFRKMGYGEAADGHDLEAMRAALRIAQRESWDDLRAFAAEHELPAAALGRLGVGLVTHLDCLAEEVRLGYEGGLRAMARRHDVVRRELTEALLAGAAREEIDAMAVHISWTVPESVVVLAVESEGLVEEIDGLNDAVLLGGIGFETLAALAPQPTGSVVVAICPEGEVEAATAALGARSQGPVAVSWPVDVADIPDAVGWVQRALDLRRRGVIADASVIDCVEHQTQIWLHGEPLLRQRLCQELLRPLLAETPNSRKILAETLLAWLPSRDSAPAIAGRLGVHPQTIRYRWKRINDLFGKQLRDPEFVIQVTMLLKASVPLWEAGDQSDFEMAESERA